MYALQQVHVVPLIWLFVTHHFTLISRGTFTMIYVEAITFS